MDSVRSPMDNLFSMLAGFSAGHESGLKEGIYNAVALFLLCLVSAVGYGLYIILSPFVKPLIWALLCGSVLFPFKCTLATVVKSWFEQVDLSNKPLFLNFTLLPVYVLDNFSESLGFFLRRNIKYICIAIGTTIFLLLVYHYTPNIFTCLSWRLFAIFNVVMGFFISTCNIYMVILDMNITIRVIYFVIFRAVILVLLQICTISIGYLTTVYLYWTPDTSNTFRYMSFVLWYLISLYLSNLTGSYQIITFLTLQILYMIGFFYEVISIMENQEFEDEQLTFLDAVRFALTNYKFTNSDKNKSTEIKEKDKTVTSEVNKKDAEPNKVTEEVAKEGSINDTPQTAIASCKSIGKKSMTFDLNTDHQYNSPKLVALRNNINPNRRILKRIKTELRLSLDSEDLDKTDTDIYIYGALYACAGMILWKHRWMLHIFAIPIIYYITKQIGSYFGIWKTIENQINALLDMVKNWCQERHQAILPANIIGLYKVSLILDKKIASTLKGSVDAVATIAVISGLLVFTLCTSIFITIQVYAEGIHMIQITGEIVNSSLINNPDIDWVPEKWEESLNSVLDNAYMYGRGAISDGIKGLVKDIDPSKAEHMEKKVLELWDRLYQAWMMSDDDPNLIGPTVDVTAIYSVWDSFKDSYGKTPLQLFNMTSIQNFAKENVGILMSVLDSVWSILKGNLSLAMSIFTELLYVILLSGSAVLNFVLSMVVFFTTLFYLLSASGTTYKPIELTTLFSPISCHKFVVALQEAVIGVFTATFKIASFFGMWTWFIHNLFQVKVTYLPAVFATVLGAVPVLDAYFACIPATIELWFTRGYIVAILFFLFHFLPCNIVITDFYKEIKGGGHPYLTGLSIAGGIFCLGAEGTIFGPLLLCCIMVIINLSRQYLHSPSSRNPPLTS